MLESCRGHGIGHHVLRGGTVEVLLSAATIVFDGIQMSARRSRWAGTEEGEHRACYKN
jgi:hypothetical protein